MSFEKYSMSFEEFSMSFEKFSMSFVKFSWGTILCYLYEVFSFNRNAGSVSSLATTKSIRFRLTKGGVLSKCQFVERVLGRLVYIMM